MLAADGVKRIYAKEKRTTSYKQQQQYHTNICKILKLTKLQLQLVIPVHRSTYANTFFFQSFFVNSSTHFVGVTVAIHQTLQLNVSFCTVVIPISIFIFCCMLTIALRGDKKKIAFKTQSSRMKVFPFINAPLTKITQTHFISAKYNTVNGISLKWHQQAICFFLFFFQFVINIC